MFATSNIYAYLRRALTRTENPGIGGSIPSQPTCFLARRQRLSVRRPVPSRALGTTDSDGTRTDAPLPSRRLGQWDDGGRGRLGFVERLELCRALLPHRLVYGAQREPSSSARATTRWATARPRANPTRMSLGKWMPPQSRAMPASSAWAVKNAASRGKR